MITEGQTGRALYLDADTCVRASLQGLLDFDLHGLSLGARNDDPNSKAIRLAATRLGMDPQNYFNSGVLLFDLSHPELPAILDRTIDIAQTEQHRLTCVDQCALNLAFKDKFAPLPEMFNSFITPEAEDERLVDDSVVVHFLRRPKPWDPNYGSPLCMIWLEELAALGRLIGSGRLRQLMALQYPATAGVYSRSGTDPANVVWQAPEDVRRPSLPAAALPALGKIGWREAVLPVLRSISSSLDRAEADAKLREQAQLAQDEPLQLRRIVECAQALLEAGRVDDADRLYTTLSEFNPTSPAGPIGLARTAMCRQDWKEAVAAWDDVIAFTGDQAKADWIAGRAQALSYLGRWSEALLAWNAAIARNPEAAKPQWIVKQASALMNLKQWEDALTCWDSAIAASAGAPNPNWLIARGWALIYLGRATEASEFLLSQRFDRSTPWLLDARLQCLLILRRLPEARSMFAEALNHSETIAELAGLVAYCARLFDGSARSEILRTLLEKITKIGSAGDRSEDAGAQTLQLRVLLALRDYDEFLRVFDRFEDVSRRDDAAPLLNQVADAIRDPEFPDHKRPKIFGIGLSRTGTTSLATALTALGFSAAHWDNPLTGDLLGEDDLPLFDAFLDTPACVEFERNYYKFPNSTFVYTVRSFPEWERSWSTYVQNWWGLSGFHEIAREMTHHERFPYGRRFTELHMGLYYNHEGYDAAFRAYDRRVRSFFADKPRDRFLELDLFSGDGWEKLCTFLNRDVPEIAFPWENKTHLHGVSNC